MILDMHCHLDLYPDPFAVAKKCQEKGLYVLSVTTTPKAWPGTSKLAEGNSRIKTALGLHPQLAHQRSHELDLFNSFLPQTKYVGEIGLDGGKEYKEYRDIQLRIFRHILNDINIAGGRVMSIHSRASSETVLEELRNCNGIPILHWFTGSKAELKRAIDIGCWFSVGPAMLTTRQGRELVSSMPKNRVLTETDGPFAKVKNQVLMPWDVILTFNQIAKIWDTSPLEVKENIWSNFKSLVSLA